MRGNLRRVGVRSLEGHTGLYRGTAYIVDFFSKVRLEELVADEGAWKVVGEIERAARSGKIGDGKVFVGPVEETAGRRTAERGAEAL